MKQYNMEEERHLESRESVYAAFLQGTANYASQMVGMVVRVPQWWTERDSNYNYLF